MRVRIQKRRGPGHHGLYSQCRGKTAGPQKLATRFIDGWHGRLTLVLVVYAAFVAAALSMAVLAFGAASAPGVDPATRAARRRLEASIPVPLRASGPRVVAGVTFLPVPERVER